MAEMIIDEMAEIQTTKIYVTWPYQNSGLFGYLILKIGWLIVLPFFWTNEGAKKLLETSTFPRGRVFHKKVRQRAVIDSMWGFNPICLIIGISNR